MATSYTFTTAAIDSHASDGNHSSTYARTITPAYEAIGRRKRLTGFLAELHDGQILLHAQEYSTYSQAEQALDALVYDLLSDLAEHGLVDDVPAALEAEMVSSASISSWQPTPEWDDTYTTQPIGWCYVCGSASWRWDNSGPLCPSHWNVFSEMIADQDSLTTSIITTMAYQSTPHALTCADPTCQGPHHIQDCPAIRARLLAPDMTEPVMMVLDVEYSPLGWAV